MVATYNLSAVGFLVLDTLCAHADEMPPKGGATFVDRMAMTVAGTAGATAFDCAMLGLKVQVAAEVGNDPMGDWLISALDAKGVSTKLISRSDTEQTSMSMLPIGVDGARSAFFVPGASNTFKLDQGRLKQLLDAEIIHLGGTGLLQSFDGEPSRNLLAMAREKGCKTVFDLILANEDTLKLVEPLLEYIDYFVPSIEEAGAMSGHREPEQVADWFINKGVANVILTLEGEGAYVASSKGASVYLPAHQLDPIDTTGCGDSFTAGIITGLTKGWELEKSARFANTVAAHVACGLGSQGILKDFNATLKAMEEWPLKGVK